MELWVRKGQFSETSNSRIRVWVYMGCICDLAVDGGLCRIHTKSLAAQLDSVCSDINKNDICSIRELILFSIYQ
jgi:hypothetical protein